MRYLKRSVLATVLVNLIIMGSGGATGLLTKTANPSAGSPFRLKEQRQARLDVARYQAFRQEIGSLSGKLSALRRSVPVLADATPELDRLNTVSDGTLTVAGNAENGTPIFISGKQLQEPALTKAGPVAPGDCAMSFLKENRTLLKINSPEKEFLLTAVERDHYGLTHVRYRQTWQGLEIWAADIVVHLNRDGVVDGFNGRYLPTPANLSAVPNVISAEQAQAIAVEHLGLSPNRLSSSKVFLNRDEGRLRLADLRPAWLVNMQKGLDGNWMYFIDSGTGEVLKYYNHIFTDGPVTGSGLDLFNQSRTIGAYQLGSEFALIDASKPMFNAGGSAFPNDGKGVIYTLDARNSDQNLFFIVSNNVNSWTSSSGISAAANGALVYDFYQQVYGRNAIGGDGTTMNLVVNFNQNFNNAFWNGQYMVFGNGDGNAFSDLAGALDVTAHEMTHGVIERTANLIYENQPGALNESFADVFGVLFEFWVKGEAGNWLLGEDITTPGAAGDALRNMADPAAPAIAFDGQQPTKMSEFQNLPNTPDGDNGGVHVNSGIPNRAFYLFATNPAVGIEKAGEIYYQALTRYLTRSAQFIDCRLAVIRSVDDVFGAATPEAAAARAAAAQAFDAVEIFDGSGTPPPPVQPPVDGTDYVAVTDAATGLLYRFDLQSQEFLQLSTKALHSRSTTTEDGSLVLFVDESGNINMVSSDGGPEVPLTENGGFSNIAISHSGRYLAAVSSYSEPVIYLFDLEDGSGLGDRQFELYTPTTAEGVTTGNILFPDRLDWTSDDETLMYDAFNIAVNANGDTTGFWDINLLDVADGGINRLFPPQPDGISIGNAVFASNTDNIIAFDYVDEAFNVSVLGVDLNSGDAGLITNNFQSLGSPSFSGDDHRVYYQYQDQQGAAVFVVDLAEDGITGLQNDAVLINGGIMPLAFTVGTRPSPVEPTAPDEAPAAFTLLQNYPNPFNPVTTIEFALPRPSVVKLQIFDLLGREVATLLDEEKSAGTHRITWDATGFASGLYIYRLQTDGFTATRKLMVLR